MADIGGAYWLEVDGIKARVTSDEPKYGLGTPEREEEVGPLGEVLGFKVTAKPSFLECTLADSTDTDVRAFLAQENATVVLGLATKKIFAMTGSTQTKGHEGNASTGKFEVRFVGTYAEEML